MGELLKFATKLLLGTTATAAGAALIKNGMKNARNINLSAQETKGNKN